MRPYKALKALDAGEILEVDGKKYKKIDKELDPGDTYIAERNVGPQVGVVSFVDPRGWVVDSNSSALYPYDTHECRVVEEVID
jgi:hypothetical protein